MVASFTAYVPTKVIVYAFIKSVITINEKESLYFYIPKEFRGKPTAFLSHAWDCFVDRLFMADGNPGIYWIDIVAINQHHPITDLPMLEQTIKDISNTILLIPGWGRNPIVALQPILRSWCVFEILNTPEGALHATITLIDNDEYEIEEICELLSNYTSRDAQAEYLKDKEDIDKKLLKRFETFEAADAALLPLIKAAFRDYLINHNMEHFIHKFA